VDANLARAGLNDSNMAARLTGAHLADADIMGADVLASGEEETT